MEVPPFAWSLVNTAPAKRFHEPGARGGYPSKTFRILKNNEMCEFGEYRTQRLVLAARDQLQAGS